MRLNVANTTKNMGPIWKYVPCETRSILGRIVQSSCMLCKSSEIPHTIGNSEVVASTAGTAKYFETSGSLVQVPYIWSGVVALMWLKLANGHFKYKGVPFLSSVFCPYLQHSRHRGVQR
eukprot:2109365-Amphidinium_carterae.1